MDELLEVPLVRVGDIDGGKDQRVTRREVGLPAEERAAGNGIARARVVNRDGALRERRPLRLRRRWGAGGGGGRHRGTRRIKPGPGSRRPGRCGSMELVHDDRQHGDDRRDDRARRPDDRDAVAALR